MSSPRLPPPDPLDLAHSALFLDLDGTLAKIEERPGDVGPDARRTTLLRRLDVALGGRLAVVSGRTIETIDAILEDSVRCAAGVHGLERRGADGQLARLPAHPGLAAARASLYGLASRREGLLLEDKGLSVALHYRLAPDAGESAQREARRLAETTGLRLQGGDQVVELRTPGADKGAAIEAFMREPPFAGYRPIFVGDDQTDEDGFLAVRWLGGQGVLVGPPRESSADGGLPDVEAVLRWLEESLA